MSLSSQIFVATHSDALRFADALDTGSMPPELPERVDAGELTDFEFEALGAIAAKAVHAAGIDTDLAMVDVAREALYVVPDPLAEVLAELTELEDPEGLEDVAREWAGSEEMEDLDIDAQPLVERIAELAAAAGADRALDLYLWSSGA
ncbi:hypothetical protein KIH31_13740 [Paenarthrobacter sp. DKR-5]|uniref:hypothetical protein n=1 Tax=Paenarthrobacter sp. DKR-5 TaxID=2835535 RepID=UPI001BDD95F8|nr:hypothetical protein [Paenarthrobacter sp. DKR-5]MBT1003664.1 hypothetical protein [Paenarthrobacter sp. DKR-5]